MRPQEIAIALQLGRELIQTPGALQHLPVGHVEQQRPPDDLAVFQLVQPDAGDAVLTAQQKALLLCFPALVDNGVHQLEECLLPDRLELVIVRPHGVGLHGKLGRGGEEDDLHIVVELPDLPGGADAALPRHDHVQQQHIGVQAVLHLRQQLQRTVEGRVLHIRTALGLIPLQQAGDLLQKHRLVVAERDLDHRAAHLPSRDLFFYSSFIPAPSPARRSVPRWRPPGSPAARVRPASPAPAG